MSVKTNLENSEAFNTYTPFSGSIFDVDKMNDCLLMGQVDPSVAEFNAEGWDLLSTISKNHFAGTRIDASCMILDEMHENALSDSPKRSINEK